MILLLFIKYIPLPYMLPSPYAPAISALQKAASSLFCLLFVLLRGLLFICVVAFVELDTAEPGTAVLTVEGGSLVHPLVLASAAAAFATRCFSIAAKFSSRVNPF